MYYRKLSTLSPRIYVIFFILVTGDEPDKTNKFLHSFYKAAKSGKDFPKFIAKYQAHIRKKKDEEDKKKAEEGGDKVPEKEKEKEKAVKGNEDKTKVTAPVKSVEKQVVVEKEKERPEVKPQKQPEKELKKEAPTQQKEKESDVKLGVDKNEVGGGEAIRMGGKIGKVKKPGDKDQPKFKSTINLKNIEEIKQHIHDISQNANPIGKLIEFLPEDVDSMNKEMEYWINESKSYKDKLEEEYKKSEEIILPLENEFMELEETIRDEIMRIKSIKSRILKNETVIQNLINGVISVKNI